MVQFFAFFLLLITPSTVLVAQEKKIEFLINKYFDLEDEHPSVHKLAGGLTNENYRVNLDNGNSYFVRDSSSRSDLLGASLEREWIATSIASASGLAPKIILYLPDEKIMVSEFIEVHGQKVDFRDKETQERFCQLARNVHGLKQKLPFEFDPFECIQAYAKNAMDKGAKLPAVFSEAIFPKIEEMKQKAIPTQKKVPCHLDLHSGNLLDDGTQMYLVDWEYSGMGDPFFDLATTACSHNFSDEEMKSLLEAYLLRAPSPEEFEHFVSMRILADARWALWCCLQEQISPEVDLSRFKNSFLDQCCQRLSI